MIWVSLLNLMREFGVLKSPLRVNVKQNSGNSSTLIEYVSVITLSSGILDLSNDFLKGEGLSDGVREEPLEEVAKATE